MCEHLNDVKSDMLKIKISNCWGKFAYTTNSLVIKTIVLKITGDGSTAINYTPARITNHHNLHGRGYNEERCLSITAKREL